MATVLRFRRKTNRFATVVASLVICCSGSLPELLIQVDFCPVECVTCTFCLTFSSESNDLMPSDLHIFQVSLNFRNYIFWYFYSSFGISLKIDELKSYQREERATNCFGLFPEEIKLKTYFEMFFNYSLHIPSALFAFTVCIF